MSCSLCIYFAIRQSRPFVVTVNVIIKVVVDEAENGRGDYTFCFDNTYSYTSSRKRIFFEIFLLDKDGNYLNDYDLKVLGNDERFATELQLSSFQRATTKVKNNLNEIERLQ